MQNQLRQNVRNYCVGLTCEEIEKEIEICEIGSWQLERAAYFKEYLAELEAEQSRTTYGAMAIGDLFRKDSRECLVYMCVSGIDVCPVVFPETFRGRTRLFNQDEKVYPNPPLEMIYDGVK